MDEQPAGVWYVSGDAHAEHGIYARVENVQDGKEYPTCMVAALVVFGLLCLIVGTVLTG